MANNENRRSIVSEVDENDTHPKCVDFNQVSDFVQKPIVDIFLGFKHSKKYDFISKNSYDLFELYKIFLHTELSKKTKICVFENDGDLRDFKEKHTNVDFGGVKFVQYKWLEELLRDGGEELLEISDSYLLDQ